MTSKQISERLRKRGDDGAPTHDGLGKHGWVTAQFDQRSKPSIALLEAWLDESYRAVAPKKMIAQLELED